MKIHLLRAELIHVDGQTRRNQQSHFAVWQTRLKTEQRVKLIFTIILYFLECIIFPLCVLSRIRTSVGVCACVSLKATYLRGRSRRQKERKAKPLCWVIRGRQYEVLTFLRAATGNATAWFDHMHLHSCGQFYS